MSKPQIAAASLRQSFSLTMIEAYVIMGLIRGAPVKNVEQARALLATDAAVRASHIDFDAPLLPANYRDAASLDLDRSEAQFLRDAAHAEITGGKCAGERAIHMVGIYDRLGLWLS